MNEGSKRVEIERERERVRWRLRERTEWMKSGERKLNTEVV